MIWWFPYMLLSGIFGSALSLLNMHVNNPYFWVLMILFHSSFVIGMFYGREITK